MSIDKDSDRHLVPIIKNNILSNIRTESGDVFSGIKKQYSFNFNAPEVDSKAILLLVQQYKNIDCESDEFVAMKEELDDYNKPRPNRDITGLSNKLKDGNRDDLIPDATYFKDKFAKRLSRYEFSTHHSAIHLTLLSKIEERFNSFIVPMIKKEEDNTVIDMAISKLVIQPLADEVQPADITLTAKQIRGMMFLLTGNCYIKWSKT
jgi:hypothetical protein